MLLSSRTGDRRRDVSLAKIFVYLVIRSELTLGWVKKGCKIIEQNQLNGLQMAPLSYQWLDDSLFSLPLSGVIRIELTNMNGTNLENCWDKISLMGCKWSSLNVPGTETPLSHEWLDDSLFPFSAFVFRIPASVFTEIDCRIIKPRY